MFETKKKSISFSISLTLTLIVIVLILLFKHINIFTQKEFIDIHDDALILIMGLITIYPIIRIIIQKGIYYSFKSYIDLNHLKLGAVIGSLLLQLYIIITNIIIYTKFSKNYKSFLRICMEFIFSVIILSIVGINIYNFIQNDKYNKEKKYKTIQDNIIDNGLNIGLAIINNIMLLWT